METTFVISPNELNSDFVNSLRNLFKNQSQLQISVTVPEDFNLWKKETSAEYFARLEKCLNELNANKNVISFSEELLDDIIFEKL